MIHLDTSFVVDLLRETGRDEPGPATKLLDRFEDEELVISSPVACELYAGAEMSARRRRERARVEEICAALRVLLPDERFAPTYGRLLAGLRRAGASIATTDLLIATSAVVHDAPLVTRNPRHFVPVADLELIWY